LYRDGVPFTHSSNLMEALRCALQRLQMPARIQEIQETSSHLRQQLTMMGLTIVNSAEHSSPAVLTLRLAKPQTSVQVGDRLAEQGYLLSYQSQYLVKDNLLQLCLMGEIRKELFPSFLACLSRAVAVSSCSSMNFMMQ